MSGRLSRMSRGGWLCGLLLLFSSGLVAATEDLSRDGVTLTVDCAPDTVDVARDFFVTVSLVTPAGTKAALPDLQDRFRGFRVAEDFPCEPETAPDGSTTLVSKWRLIPHAVAKRYELRPFAVELGAIRFCTRKVAFPMPVARESVTGGMEVNPKKDVHVTWKLGGQIALALLALALVVWGVVRLAKAVRTAIRVHRMSPIQRAYYELERLVAKGLPGRGYYKDFYVELTLVVRRYVERKYGVKAPNMTTDEFLAELKVHPQAVGRGGELGAFLASADLVKFAGLEATPEMADEATGKARDYLAADDREPVSAGGAQ